VTTRLGLGIAPGVALLALSVAIVGGCHDSSTTGSGTQVDLTANPATTETGREVTFTVTGINSARSLTLARIDYESDGTWDDTRQFDSTSITAIFTHAYTVAGSYTARAQVVASDGIPAAKTAAVTIAVPTLVPISYQLTAVPSCTGAGCGNCSASGPPATCDGCLTSLSRSMDNLYTPLGSRHIGDTVAVTQSFRQTRYGGTGARYSCDYAMALYARSAGVEKLLASGTCETSSLSYPYDPADLACSVSLSALVP
jgi:hypothetical protein